MSHVIQVRVPGLYGKSQKTRTGKTVGDDELSAKAEEELLALVQGSELGTPLHRLDGAPGVGLRVLCAVRLKLPAKGLATSRGPI